MYNTTSEMIETLRTMLETIGIQADEYTDTQLAGMIQNAATLIGEEYTTPRSEVDYDYDFHGDLYLTAEYPILARDLQIQLDERDITESIQSITNEGVIHFKEKQDGVLRVTYNVGLAGDVVQEYILLAAMYLAADNSHKGNISSITEGDVSISYNTTSNTYNSLDSVIRGIHEMFGARVKMI
jgi:hypothetical protein